MEMPIYLFTGFLDAGKTKFIQETLEDPRFYDGERTLVILCEEGDEEYEPLRYPSENVFFEVIEDQSELNQKNLLAMQKKYRMQRVLVEYNGMWELSTLFNNLPASWIIYQEMLFVDSTTFAVYNANMRNLVADKLRTCETVIFNRVEPGADLMQYHKEVRTFSRSASIIYEYKDGKIEYDEIEDPLPFDVNAPVIEIEDKDYALWYRDLMEDNAKYAGKTVKYKGLVSKTKQMPSGQLAIGRHIMTCCVEDITYGAIMVRAETAEQFKTKDWVVVKGKISLEYSEVYKQKGPVLHAQEVDVSLPPEQEVATFY